MSGWRGRSAVKLRPGGCGDISWPRCCLRNAAIEIYGDLINAENRRDAVVRGMAACGYRGRQPLALGRVGSDNIFRRHHPNLTVMA